MKIKLNNNETEISNMAVEVIKQGGLVVLPFDTVYGFICDPRNNIAVDKIFDLKQRPVNKTIGLAVSDISAVTKVAYMSQQSSEFIKTHTPGRYTFILNAKANTGLAESCLKNKTVAVRIPDSSIIHKITSDFGEIAQTSANISGQENCYSINDLIAQYGENLSKIDLVIDGGEIEKLGASTLSDLTKDEPKIVERN